jgi:hypothetical protein
MSRRRQPRNRQTAKHKLNSAHFLGSLVVAGLIGGATGSVGVFLLALVVFVAVGLHSGDIRS